jgi:hypothetical protein
MFLKHRTRTKDGKTHAYYSVCESLRLSRNSTFLRRAIRVVIGKPA